MAITLDVTLSFETVAAIRAAKNVEDAIALFAKSNPALADSARAVVNSVNSLPVEITLKSAAGGFGAEKGWWATPSASDAAPGGGAGCKAFYWDQVSADFGLTTIDDDVRSLEDHQEAESLCTKSQQVNTPMRARHFDVVVVDWHGQRHTKPVSHFTTFGVLIDECISIYGGWYSTCYISYKGQLYFEGDPRFLIDHGVAHETVLYLLPDASEAAIEQAQLLRHPKLPAPVCPPSSHHITVTIRDVDGRTTHDLDIDPDASFTELVALYTATSGNKFEHWKLKDHLGWTRPLPTMADIHVRYDPDSTLKEVGIEDGAMIHVTNRSEW